MDRDSVADETYTARATLDGPGRVSVRMRGHRLPLARARAVGAADGGPTPPEALLAALGGSLVQAAEAAAAEHALELRAMEVALRGELDAAQRYALSGLRPNGYLRCVTAQIGILVEGAAPGIRHLQRQTELCPVAVILRQSGTTIDYVWGTL